MTTTDTATFGASDRSRSNECGVTLMNNQIGQVVAEVMSTKEGVSIRILPAMIRVDGKNKMDFDYDELTEATGIEFDESSFEEVMSTHYGRMVHLDDRVLLFANPEGAAEYIGFDLVEVS